MAELIELIDGKQGIKFSLDRDTTRLGRGEDNDIVIADELISKSHALIECHQFGDNEMNRYVISDQSSTNGTIVNGESIERVSLWHGDLIQLGMSFFKFNDEKLIRHDLSKTTELHKSWIPGLYYTKKKN